MQHDPSAYLNEFLEAAAAIQEATGAIDEATCSATRLIRSAVEREFIIIGEAVKMIAQRAPQLFAAIPEGRRIIVFRNLLTHDYLNVSDRLSGVPCRRICPTWWGTAPSCAASSMGRTA